MHHLNRPKLRNSTPGFLNTSTAAKFTMFSNIFFSRECCKERYFCKLDIMKPCLAASFAYLTHGFEITINDSLCCKDFRHLWLVNG